MKKKNAILAILAAFLLSGCGGNDEQSTTINDVLTEEEIKWAHEQIEKAKWLSDEQKRLEELGQNQK